MPTQTLSDFSIGNFAAEANDVAGGAAEPDKARRSVSSSAMQEAPAAPAPAHGATWSPGFALGRISTDSIAARNHRTQSVAERDAESESWTESGLPLSWWRIAELGLLMVLTGWSFPGSAAPASETRRITRNLFLAIIRSFCRSTVRSESPGPAANKRRPNSGQRRNRLNTQGFSLRKLATFGAVALMATTLFAADRIQHPPRMPRQSLASSTATVSVSGVGVVTTTPDTASVQLGVTVTTGNPGRSARAGIDPDAGRHRRADRSRRRRKGHSDVVVLRVGCPELRQQRQSVRKSPTSRCRTWSTSSFGTSITSDRFSIAQWPPVQTPSTA